MRKRKANHGREWTHSDLKILKSMAGVMPAPRIAKRLKRTEGAVRQKALILDLSLDAR